MLDALISSAAFPLYAAAVGAIIIAGISIYIGLRLGVSGRPEATLVVGDLDAMTERLSEAEKIGHFGSFLWDFENKLHSSWSDELYELLDMPRQHIPPSPEEFLAFAYEQDRELVKKAWEQVIFHSGAFAFAFRAVSKQGRLMHLKVQGKTVMGIGKDPLRIAGVAHDITKEMEVDRAKSEFVSLASHQLKTPLTSLRWLAEALLRGSAGELGSEQKKYVTNMYDASQRMVAMVNELLNVSRIETDTLSIRPEEVDVCVLAQSVIDEQRHAADARHLTLDLVCAEGLPVMHADKNLVRMVFQNLLSNAIKYTPDNGAVKCEISLAALVREMIFVAVKDSGIGIPKAEQSRVFEKLHRASNAEALVPDGTGLGLYLVKTILDRVGGGVTFESVEGKGTTFFVSIPVVWKASGDKPIA